MSFTDRLVLWLHIAFAIFTIGPVTIAIMSTPRFIRARNQVIVRYLLRTTRIYAFLSLGVLVFGVVSAQQRKDFSHPWLTVAMTLFVVALVLLVIIMRDQHRAIAAMELATAAAAEPVGAKGSERRAEAAREASGEAEDEPGRNGGPHRKDGHGHQDEPDRLLGTPDADVNPVASVERGRIATMGGVVAFIYLVILILMVWKP